MFKIDSVLEESNDIYQFLINNILDVVVEVDLDGTFSYISPRVYDIFGYKPEELVGNRFFSYIHLDDMEKTLKTFEKAIRGKKIILVEYRVRHKKGYYIPVRAKGSLVKINNKVKIIGVLRDISEQKIAEQKLRESEAKYRMIFTGASDPIAILDNVKIIDCNDLAVKLFGYDDKSEIIGQPPWKISPRKQPDGRNSVEKANEHIQKAVSGEPQSFYWKHLKKDGILFDAEISLSSFKLDNKTYIMAIIRDITERKKAEKELREISQLKTELLERTSHELKTPIISIKGFTDLLLDLHKEKFDDDVFSILEEIKNGTEQLETLINRLLETSLLESEQIKFNPKEEDLSFLIRFCVRNLHGLAKTRNHFITLNIPNKLIIKFEKERIYDVISHLIINAIKNSPPYGKIKITTEKIEGYVNVCVQDNGIGLSQEEQKKIFKQFGKIERYGQGWDIGIEGTGMGLYTSKKIIELHGGKIWVESEGRNKGAKFCFTLPY